MLVILATRETEIGRIAVPGQPQQKQKFVRPYLNGKRKKKRKERKAVCLSYQLWQEA
jgi:hypothetical protein